jgi:hypothetical protein
VHDVFEMRQAALVAGSIGLRLAGWPAGPRQRGVGT